MEFNMIYCDKLANILSFVCVFAGGSLHAEPAWLDQEGPVIAASSENIPQFPHSLSGFMFEPGRDFWGHPFKTRGNLRVFQGMGWQGIPGFPNSQSSCSAGKFMIRWRSANPDVIVKSSSRYSARETFYDNMKMGAYGYITGSNCEQPMFDFGRTSNGNDSSLVDIYYELRFWQASP